MQHVASRPSRLARLSRVGSRGNSTTYHLYSVYARPLLRRSAPAVRTTLALRHALRTRAPRAQPAAGVRARGYTLELAHGAAQHGTGCSIPSVLSLGSRVCPVPTVNEAKHSERPKQALKIKTKRSTQLSRQRNEAASTHNPGWIGTQAAQARAWACAHRRWAARGACVRRQPHAFSMFTSKRPSTSPENTQGSAAHQFRGWQGCDGRAT